MPIDFRLKDAISTDGTLALVVRRLMEALIDVGGTWDDFRQLDQRADLRRQVGELLIKARIDWLESYTLPCPSQPRVSLDALRGRHSWIDAVESDCSTTEPVTIRLVRIVANVDEEVNWQTFSGRASALGTQLGFHHLLCFLEDLRSIEGATRHLGCERIFFPGVTVRSDGRLLIPGIRFSIQQGILDVAWKRINERFDGQDWVAAPVKK